jgi:DNA topoisomerase-3
MEHAGKLVDDEALRAAMKDSGLGTPATRASIIETIIKRGFVHREGKALVPTPMGIGLIDALPIPSLASPELTGSWEARLARIARRKEQRAMFMKDIGRYVLEMVQACRGSGPMPTIPTEAPKTKRVSAKRNKVSKAVSPVTPSSLADLGCPVCKQGNIMTGKRGWGCTRWREGCSFVIWFEENGQKRNEADMRRIIAGG